MEKIINNKINMIDAIIIICIIYILISSVFVKYGALFQYSDEIITIILVVTVFVYGLRRKIYIYKSDISIIKYILIIILLGVISNYYFKYQTNMKIIALDIYSTFKGFIVFLAIRILKTQNKCNILDLFFLPAKIFLIVATFFGILSLFLDLGMGGEVRYGIASYKFIYPQEHYFAITSIICMLIINHKKSSTFYTILTCICQILTTKGPSLIFATMIFIFKFIYKKNIKLNLKMIIIIGILSITLGSYQIKTYITNEDSPRYLFMYYGLITAIDCFPLGSGFATFGSDMAAKNYSVLYKDYGFNYLHGMNENDTSFLNDTYWPMIYAQFGIVGLIFMLLIFIRIFNNINIVKKQKELLIFFIYLLIHSLGSATLTSSIGVLSFLIIGLLIEENGDKCDEKNY